MQEWKMSEKNRTVKSVIQQRYMNNYQRYKRF